MIEKVLVIAQGPNDFGFISGLRDRLGCRARLIDHTHHPLLRQRSKHVRTKDAKLIWQECQRVSADLIVRVTDADDNRPQDVKRKEIARFPPEARSVLICAVCDCSIEHWLSIDAQYASKELKFGDKTLPSHDRDRAAFIKRRIAENRGNIPCDQYVANYIRHAPIETIKLWLQEPTFRDFYDQCVSAAKTHHCEVVDERSAS